MHSYGGPERARAHIEHIWCGLFVCVVVRVVLVRCCCRRTHTHIIICMWCGGARRSAIREHEPPSSSAHIYIHIFYVCKRSRAPHARALTLMQKRAYGTQHERQVSACVHVCACASVLFISLRHTHYNFSQSSAISTRCLCVCVCGAIKPLVSTRARDQRCVSVRACVRVRVCV